MRTKTLALSAVLGALGTASLVAQTNVYSLNAVGYINVTMPPGYSIITCPLIVGTDSGNGFPNVTNDLNVVLNNNVGGAAPYSGAQVYPFINGVGYGNAEIGNPASFGGGWAGGGGDVTMMPGQAVFFFNPNPIGGANMTATFVGTVPQGSLTNTLPVGYSLVGSMVPVSGDLVTNSVSALSTSAQSGDFVFFFNPNPHAGAQYGFENSITYTFGSWSAATGPIEINAFANNGGEDPGTLSPAQGFFYNNGGAAGTEKWVENFSINP